MLMKLKTNGNVKIVGDLCQKGDATTGSLNVAPEVTSGASIQLVDCGIATRVETASNVNIHTYQYPIVVVKSTASSGNITVTLDVVPNTTTIAAGAIATFLQVSSGVFVKLYTNSV